MNNILVCYFSAGGNTKRVAENLASTIQGELFEIEPVEKYTHEDLDYTNKESRTTIEMTQNIKKKKKNTIPNIDNYNQVCIGFPIWWYKEPTIIDKFFEDNDLSGKQIYVFATSGSSTIDSTINNLKENYPNLNFVNAKRFSGNEDKQEYSSLIN